jgi:hypothetical protein
MKTEEHKPKEASGSEEQAIATDLDAISARLKEPGDLAASHPTLALL